MFRRLSASEAQAKQDTTSRATGVGASGLLPPTAAAVRRHDDSPLVQLSGTLSRHL